MRCKDFEEAEAKRTAKEKAEATIGIRKRGRMPNNTMAEREKSTMDSVKQGRKRKNSAPEAEADLSDRERLQ